MDLTNTSLRDQLQATYDELSEADPTPANVASEGSSLAQGAPAAESAGAAAPDAEAGKTSPADPLAQAEADAQRDEKGRFKAKDTTAEGAAAAAPAEPKPETATPAESGPQATETTRVPPSLPAAVKAKFASLDPDVQSAFVALEGSVQGAKAEWGKKGERLNRFEEIIGPHLPRWEMNGLDAFSGIQSLIAAQSLLDRNPVDGLVQIARSYGLTPAHLAQAFGLSQANGQQPGQEGQPAPTGAPDWQAALQQHVAPLAQQVQTLQQQLQASAQQSEAAQITDLTNQIKVFAAKPENMYFDNVSDAIVEHAQRLKAAGTPVTMDLISQAYERAIWADPEIRPLLIKAQADAAAQEATRKAEDARKATEQAARAKAQASNHAGGSVTGSPTAGSRPAAAPQGSVRESLLAAMQENGAV